MLVTHRAAAIVLSGLVLFHPTLLVSQEAFITNDGFEGRPEHALPKGVMMNQGQTTGIDHYDIALLTSKPASATTISFQDPETTKPPLIVVRNKMYYRNDKRIWKQSTLFGILRSLDDPEIERHLKGAQSTHLSQIGGIVLFVILGSGATANLISDEPSTEGYIAAGLAIYSVWWALNKSNKAVNSILMAIARYNQLVSQME